MNFPRNSCSKFSESFSLDWYWSIECSSLQRAFARETPRFALAKRGPSKLKHNARMRESDCVFHCHHKHYQPGKNLSELFPAIFEGARLRGPAATQRSEKGSEKVLEKVLGKGFSEGF